MKIDTKKLANEVYRWCIKNDLWGDNCMYFNGKAWASWKEWHGEYGEKIDDNLYEYQNKNPREYFEYVRDPNIFSMSFEGPLYRVLNAYTPGWVKKEAELMKIFEKYDLYMELGDSWNLSAYEI